MRWPFNINRPENGSYSQSQVQRASLHLPLLCKEAKTVAESLVYLPPETMRMKRIADNAQGLHGHRACVVLGGHLSPCSLNSRVCQEVLSLSDWVSVPASSTNLTFTMPALLAWYLVHTNFRQMRLATQRFPFLVMLTATCPVDVVPRSEKLHFCSCGILQYAATALAPSRCPLNTLPMLLGMRNSPSFHNKHLFFDGMRQWPKHLCVARGLRVARNSLSPH